jgi:hypothetical protein
MVEVRAGDAIQLTCRCNGSVQIALHEAQVPPLEAKWRP